MLTALTYGELSLPARGPRVFSGGAGAPVVTCHPPRGLAPPRRLEKTCVDLLQTTLCSPKCPEQLQFLCAAILRERSPADSLSLSWDHVQSSQQLSLVASVLLAQVTRPSCPWRPWGVHQPPPCPPALSPLAPGEVAGLWAPGSRQANSGCPGGDAPGRGKRGRFGNEDALGAAAFRIGSPFPGVFRPDDLSPTHSGGSLLHTPPVFRLKGDKKEEVRSVGQHAFRVLESRQPEGPSLRHLLPVLSKVTHLAPHTLHEGSHPSREACAGAEREECPRARDGGEGRRGSLGRPEGPAPCPELVF